MQDSTVAPPLRLPTRAASSAAPVGRMAAFVATLRRLDHVRQAILVGLAALAALIIVMTTAYALIPAGVTPVVTRQAAATLRLPSTAVAGQPLITGQYVLSDISADVLTLDLHVFGANVTGTLTTQDCTGQPVTAVVTGHFVSATTLMLTIAQPRVSHVTTILYTVTHTDDGFSLNWRDTAGQPQVQHWATTTRSLASTTCQMVP